VFEPRVYLSTYTYYTYYLPIKKIDFDIDKAYVVPVLNLTLFQSKPNYSASYMRV
jgi:hypothetical protein